MAKHRPHLLGAPWVALIALMAISTLHSVAASGQPIPCGDLPVNKSKEYFDLSLAAIEDYKVGNYDAAVDKNKEAIAICGDDPSIIYNIARAYHKAGDCHMAVFNYQRYLTNDLDKKTQKKVEGYLDEMLSECAAGISFTVECADPATRVDFGRFTDEACPFQGRAAAGAMPLHAHRDGYKAYDVQVSLDADGQVVQVPGLVNVDDFGVLHVGCTSNLTDLVIIGPQGEMLQTCPFEGEVPVGTYTVRSEQGGEAVTVDVIGQQRASAELAFEDTPFGRGGALFVVALAPGMGLVSGDLYDDGERTIDSVEGPSAFGFAGVVELGYAFTEQWAALGHVRVDLGMGVLGAAVGRYTPLVVDKLAVHTTAGLGAGSIVQPVRVPGDYSNPSAVAEPFFVLLGADAGYAVTDVIALVGGLDLYLAVLGDFALQADITLGIEARF